jgi:DNA-binding CsgD family transcriptional regulator
MSDFYVNLIGAMSQANSIDDLRETFQKSMSDLDLGQFTYQIIDHNFLHNMKNFYVTSFSNEWEKRYLNQNYFEVDPLVNQYKSQITPFLWGSDQSDEHDGQTKKMFMEASDFNLHHGVGIPIPGPQKSFSILTLCSESSQASEIKKVYENYYKDMLIAGLYFHSSVISMSMGDTMHVTDDLTNREMDCLKWMCVGKSNQDIATISGVSLSAIKARIAGIFKKMNVSTRHEAVLKAYKYKMVEF